MKHIIFIEGISGVGKSTMTTLMGKELTKLGYKTTCYLEGDSKNPLDLFWVTYLTRNEYESVLLSYPEFSNELSKNSIMESDYVLVRYQTRRLKFYSHKLYEYLKAHEFCYRPQTPISFTKYKEVFSILWKRFSEGWEEEQEYYIFDGSLMHHQINDMIRNYNVSENEIIKHLTALLGILQPSNTVVFYLSSHNVEERMMGVGKIRGKPHTADEQIRFWENRKRLDLLACDSVLAETHILDVTDGNWNDILDVMLSYVLKEKKQITEHYDCLIDENNDPVYDPEPLKSYMDKRDGQDFIDELQLSSDKTVLEIGVGTGRLAIRVCGCCKSFTGIDISPKTINRAKENLKDFGNTTLVCDDFLNFHFNDYSNFEMYDVIYSSLTFMHIKDKQLAIKIVADLLKPAGRFVLSISKEQCEYIEYGNRKISVYPDNSEEICRFSTNIGMQIENRFETDSAVVIAAKKR